MNNGEPIKCAGVLNATEFSEKLQTGDYIVIDVRTPEEYENQRITDDALAINIFDDDFKEQLEELDKDLKYLVYCRHGHRSSNAGATMKGLEFKHVDDLLGGITEWNAAGLPTFAG